MLICVDSNLEQLRHRIETLRHLLAEHPWEGIDALSQVTASFGIASCPEHGSDARELFIAVDEALYRAKASGRNRVEAALIKPLTP